MKALLPTLLSALLPVCLFATTSLAWAGKAHQHGVAQLDVAVEPTRVALELDTPLDNLLGFERAPRTDAERAVVDKALARLRAPDGLFRIDSAAGCTLAKVSLVSAVLGLAAPGVDAAKAAEAAKGEHAELNGRFEFTCKAGSRASFVEVNLFEAFAQLKRIELQLVLPRGQMKASLLRPATRVALVR